MNELICQIEGNEVTVNSSLNAVGAYEKLGFDKIGLPSEVNGIKYQPMIYIRNENT